MAVMALFDFSKDFDIINHELSYYGSYYEGTIINSQQG